MTIQQHFERFDRDNPEIYRFLVSLALQVKRKGYSTYGMKSIWERLRWHLLFELNSYTDGSEEYKLNNNFTSRYARKIMNNVPELSSFFETRRLTN